MIRKGLALVVILLFFGMCVIPSTSTIIKEPYNQVSSGNTFFVGGTGPNNYTEIQEAINNASDFDTVYVYNGTYQENLVIDKSINIIGEDRNTTTIDGSFNGNTITLTADSININNFNIIGENGVLLDSSHNYISCNIMNIENACIKNSLDNSNSNTISNNRMIHNDYYTPDPTEDYVVFLTGSNNNLIIKNEIFSYYDSGLVVVGNCNNISENIFLNSYYYPYETDYKTDIYIEGNKNIISNNTLESPTESSYIGIRIEDNSRYNNIIGNTIYGYLNSGIYIRDSYNNNILKNHITHCNYGITFYTSHDNNISYNQISSNLYNGIILYHSTENNISYNIFNNNNNGVHNYDRSRNNIIYHNNFLDNKNDGEFTFFSYINNWNENYWGEPRYLPYPIFGNFGYGMLLYFICFMIFGIEDIHTMVNFDWHPASEPYDMEV